MAKGHHCNLYMYTTVDQYNPSSWSLPLYTTDARVRRHRDGVPIRAPRRRRRQQRRGEALLVPDEGDGQGGAGEPAEAELCADRAGDPPAAPEPLTWWLVSCRRGALICGWPGSEIRGTSTEPEVAPYVLPDGEDRTVGSFGSLVSDPSIQIL